MCADCGRGRLGLGTPASPWIIGPDVTKGGIMKGFLTDFLDAFQPPAVGAIRSLCSHTLLPAAAVAGLMIWRGPVPLCRRSMLSLGITTTPRGGEEWFRPRSTSIRASSMATCRWRSSRRVTSRDSVRAPARRSPCCGASAAPHAASTRRRPRMSVPAADRLAGGAGCAGWVRPPAPVGRRKVLSS
jgi:hypothetical protein